MSSDDRFQKAYAFRYDNLIPGVVQACYAIDKDRRLFATVAALDGRGVYKALVTGTYGVSRNVRRGMTVLLGFRHGASTWAVIVSHITNLETSAGYTNPLPPPHANVDDQVYFHPETGAFLRFRTQGSTAVTAQPDGTAGVAELTMASGMSLKLSEYAQSGSPLPPPNRGKATIVMPSGASMVIDEPTEGQATFALTLPSGFSFTVDTVGNVAMNSPTEIAINAPRVTTGGPDGSGKPLAFLDDVQRFVAAYDSHTHPDEGGAPPSTPAPAPIGTHNTEAV